MLVVVLLTFLINEFHGLASLQWNTNENVRWPLGCDFLVGDMGNVPTNGEGCGGKCSERPSCTHFVWRNFNTNEKIDESTQDS